MIYTGVHISRKRARIMEACDEINVRDLLPSVSLPTMYSV